MFRRNCDYYYKNCILEKNSQLDKMRYEILNEYGYNFDSCSKRIVDMDMKIKRHKNSDIK